MEYAGIDYINKTPAENLQVLLDGISIELVKSNETLYDHVKKIAANYIDIMIKYCEESDKNGGQKDSLWKLAPTWKAIKEELNNL